MTAKTLADYYTDRKDMAPFADGDTDILLDVTLTTQALAEAAGFTVGGTGAVFNANGFNGKGTAWLYANPWADAAELAAAKQGSIYLQVERLAMTVDESDVPSAYIQSTGTTGASQRYLFQIGGTAVFTYDMYIERDTQVNTGYTNFHVKNNNTAYNKTRVMNSQTPTDATSLMDIVLTWNGTTVKWFVDGLQQDSFVVGTDFVESTFQKMIVGAQTVAGLLPLGDFYIKRLQISKRASTLATNPTKIAIFGDSFAKAFTDDADYSKVSDVSKLVDGTGRGGQYSGLRELIRLFAVNDNFMLYNFLGSASTENGHGWASDLGGAFSAATISAVTSYNPEIIIAFGSRNDNGMTDGTAPIAADILADIQTTLDTWIDGCSHLREIHFIEIFPDYKGSTATAVTYVDLYLAEYDRLRSVEEGINGYRSKVYYHPVFDLFGGDDYNPELTIGSGTGNIVDADANVHPSSSGHIKMGEIIYNAIRPYLIRMPT